MRTPHGALENMLVRDYRRYKRRPLERSGSESRYLKKYISIGLQQHQFGRKIGGVALKLLMASLQRPLPVSSGLGTGAGNRSSAFLVIFLVSGLNFHDLLQHGKRVAQADGAVEHRLARRRNPCRARNSPAVRTASPRPNCRHATDGSIRASGSTSSDSGLRSAAKFAAFGLRRSRTADCRRGFPPARIRGRQPVHGGLDLAAVRRVAAFGRGIVGAAQFDHFARVVLDNAGALDEIGVAQPHLVARRQAEELLRRVLHEIVALDVELAAERIFRVPAAGSSGWLTASSSSTWPSG